ncbi:MAG: ABC transporter substrate-binding protein [Treponema sp.]|nr:ABC transporter substrate-binding protein [Treponema sp.]
MKKCKIFLLISILILTFAVFPSCKGEDDDGLRYGFTTEPSTLDPLNPSNTADGRSILFNVFEGLVKPHTDGTMLPCIAESWVIEQEGLAYIFTLRSAVRFHDGSVVTPADVKFSLETAANAEFDSLANISEVIIQGDNTIKIILKSRDPDFLPYLTIGIVKADNKDREKNVIGTGPFVMGQYTPQRRLVLTKFADYWQSNLPHLEKITIVFFANYDTLMVALRGGSIDGAFLTGSMAAQLDHRKYNIYSNNSAAVQLMALNNASAPFNSMEARLAVNYGIDIHEIIEAAFFGAGEPSGSPIIPGLSLYYENSLSYEYNPETARTLLKEAGYSDTNKLSFEITVPSNYSMHVDTAQVIVEQLERIGVDVKIKLVDWSTWLSDVYFGRQYQATIISLDSSSASPRGFLKRYRSNDGSNFINFKNNEFDDIFNSTLSEIDSAKRIALYKDAQRIIADNAASVYIQDILYFITFRNGTYDGAIDYPLYVIDFAAIYRIKSN